MNTMEETPEKMNTNDNEKSPQIKDELKCTEGVCRKIQSEKQFDKNEKVVIKQHSVKYFPTSAFKSKDKRGKVNNIIININNHINNVQTEQGNISLKNGMLNTMSNITHLGKKINMQVKPFDEVDLNYSSKYKCTMDITQNECAAKLSRMLQSLNCRIYYLLYIFITVVLSLSALVEIFMRYQLMNTIWMFAIEMTIVVSIILDFAFSLFVRKSEYIKNYLIVINDFLIIIFLIIQIVIFSTSTYAILSLCSHLLFCVLMTCRFGLAFTLVLSSLKYQKDVMQNIEEIINFSDFDDKIERNLKIRHQKITPAISFVEEETTKDKKGLNLMRTDGKEEKKEINPSS